MGSAAVIAEVESTYAWWRLAGVEDWAGEAPCLWFDDPKPVKKRVAESGAVAGRAPRLGEAPASAGATPLVLPDNLPALTDWLLTSDAFAAVGPRRLTPAGPVGGTMIVVDMPELADIDAGRLFAGELTAQVDALLAAVGLSRDTAYLATMLPGRTPSGRIPPDLLATATDALHRHVGLVAPTQLWAMGDAAAQALFGTRVDQRRRDLLDHHGIPGIATVHPRLLLDDPDRSRRKAMWPVMQALFPKDPA